MKTFIFAGHDTSSSAVSSATAMHILANAYLQDGNGLLPS